MEEIDRLPDWAFTEEELDTMAVEVLEPAATSVSKHLALYELYKEGVSTNIVILLAVESINDGLHAINRVWGEVNLYAEILEFNEKASEGSCYKMNHLLQGLENIKYTPKKRLAGWRNMLYKKEWLKDLL